MSIQLTNKKLKEMIDNANKITFITGAGISTGSGIADFKQLDNQLADLKLSKEYLLNIRTFVKDPEYFWKYYDQFFNRNILKNAQPGITHKWISQLQNTNKDINVITQNIDGLHLKADSKNVAEIHGNYEHLVCYYCDNAYDPDEINTNQCPFCNQLLKPNIVLYGEDIMCKDRAEEYILQSDLLIVMGTRLNVYPCNSFVDLFLYEKRLNPNLKLVIWNNDYTPYHKYSDYNIYENFEDFLK